MTYILVVVSTSVGWMIVLGVITWRFMEFVERQTAQVWAMANNRPELLVSDNRPPAKLTVVDEQREAELEEDRRMARERGRVKHVDS